MITAADYREAIAYHEAGHGVLDVVTGQRFRYITLQPRDRAHAGHVMVDCAPKWGSWRNEAASLFAGIIAEDLWWSEMGPPTLTEERRRILTQDAGRTDMRNARDVVRLAWARQRANPRYSLTLVNPAWSVRDMAVQAWRHAVLTVAAHGEAVSASAELLLTQSHAVTWAQAREIVAGCEVAEVPVEHPSLVDLLRPWFLDHSRLSWEPKGATRPVFMPAAAREGSCSD